MKQIESYIIEAVKRATTLKTSAFDQEAEVVRIEGDTAWVHFAGGVPETPVKLTIDAKKGDKVQCHVSSEGAFIVGNVTAPPTDDTEALIVKKEVNAVKKIAENATTIAGNTNQYFWHTETGTDTGAHITEIPKNQFLANPNIGGGNLLARSNGIAIRDGLDELATLKASGQTFNNKYGYEVFTVARHDTSTYNSKGNWTEYDNSSPFNYVLPWDCISVTTVTYLDSNREVINGLSVAYTVNNRTISFNSAACTTLQANNVKYIDVTYQAEGEFPYFTLGSEGVGLRGRYSICEGENCVASGDTAHAEGEATVSSGINSHAEGRYTTASGANAHAEGYGTTSSNNNSHAEGRYTTASGSASHAEGYGSTASGDASHAEGGGSTVDGVTQFPTASGINSHAEGSASNASGNSAHAEGQLTTASGSVSHAEGYKTVSKGMDSHAQNVQTIASNYAQTVLGKYNIEDTTGTASTVGTYALILGNGTSDSARSNALTVAWNGNTVIAGTLTQGSDRRLKDHIDYLGENAADFIRQLKPAHYRKDGADHVGFYAQDVESADKWNCMVGEINGFKTLGYTELIAPLVAYCQSLEARITELERK